MTKEEHHAKQQLDSVTDVVQEKELDASKAQEAMSALATSKAQTADANGALQTIAVSKEHIAFITNQLEVTDDVATLALRKAAAAEEPLVTALQSLIAGE